VLHPAVCLVSGWLYSTYYHGSGKLADLYLWASLGGLLGLWASALAVLALFTPHDQRFTFVSCESGSEYARHFVPNRPKT